MTDGEPASGGIARRHFISALPLAAAFAGSGASACSTCDDGGFKLFEFLMHSGKPDLSRLGIRRVTIVDRDIWPEGAGKHSAPDPERVRAVLARIPDKKAPVILDFEFLPVTGSSETVADSRRKLERIVSMFRRAAPDRDFGFYSTLPVGDYWRATGGMGGETAFRAWQRDSQRLAPLEPRVDFLAPSLYAHYDDRAGWVAYAKAHLGEARRLSSKPVYAFLWPEYHPGSEAYSGKPVEADFWRLQLETVHRHADGVVLWGGYDLGADRAREWNERAPWWQETLAFVDRLRRAS